MVFVFSGVYSKNVRSRDTTALLDWETTVPNTLDIPRATSLVYRDIMGKNKNKNKKRHGSGGESKPGAKQTKQEQGPLVKQEDLRRNVREEFPKIPNETYFVPAAHLNQVCLKQLDFSGQPVYIPQPPVSDMPKKNKEETSSDGSVNIPQPLAKNKPTEKNEACDEPVQESSYRDDLAHQRVLHCLHMITEADPGDKFVISQLKYEDYLRHPVPNPATPPSTSAPSHPQAPSPTTATLPVTADLKDIQKRRGDFDILILSRDHGFVNIEIKAVGDLAESQTNKAVLKKLIQAVSQLNKGRKVLQHLTSDKRPAPTIRSALALPNVSENKITNILHDNPQVRNDLCQCLNILESEDPVKYCLLADCMPPTDTPWQFDLKVKDKLLQWWRLVLGERRAETALSVDVYEDLVARFCGPATFPSPFNDHARPRCRTVSEAASEIGDSYNRLILRDRQLDILKTGGNLRFLSGPPGTGKTVLLVLKAVQWIKETKHVHVVSTWSGSLAASHHIASVLRHFIKDHQQVLVHVHELDLRESGDEPPVKTLLAAATKGSLGVICDEAYSGSEFPDLCTQLITKCPGVCLWAASVYHGYRPDCLVEETLAEPLRSPPAITREVARSDVMEQGLVRKYNTQAMATTQLTDGLPPIKIVHHGFGHSKKWAGECELCGELLGDELRKLCAGSSMSSIHPAVMTSTGHPHIVPYTKEHRPLSYRDVFILTTYFDLEDGAKGEGEDKRKVAGDDAVDAMDDIEMEEEGGPTASGLLKGLRKKNVPYRVVAKGDSRALQEVAVMSGPDAVVVADADTIRGLERKVVVWVPYDRHDMNDESGEEDFGRLDAMSRARAQLILITDY